MSDAHGIIFAYSAAPELRELVSQRTASSLPFAGRYRLIDFSLSSLMNAGIHDVGIIMKRDYQSLLDHVGTGKAWDMSRKTGGMRLLPPFGLPEYHRGDYTGTIEALNAVSTYVNDIKQENLILMIGGLCANIDISEALNQHIHSGAGITAICTDREPEGVHYRYIPGENGSVKDIVFSGTGDGYSSLECYIVKKAVLTELMDRCRTKNLLRFHKDAIAMYLADGGSMGMYIHRGYVSFVRTVASYFKANQDMLDSQNRSELFTSDRPVRTKNVEEVSTYYGESSSSKNCLVADNCIIEGSIENCIVFSGARIAKGAQLRNCILMRGCDVGAGTDLEYVIADKNTGFGAGLDLTGSPRLPIVVPKGEKI